MEGVIRVKNWNEILKKLDDEEFVNSLKPPKKIKRIKRYKARTQEYYNSVKNSFTIFASILFGKMFIFMDYSIYGLRIIRGLLQI